MNKQYLVIGALGNVGTEVVHSLLKNGCQVRAADINAEGIKNRFGESVEAVSFDFLDPSTFSPVFSEIEAMFIMRPPQITNIKRDMYPALDAAKSAGVKHVVFLSLIGIEKSKYVPHYKVEEYLTRSSMSWTFLRCSFFMQNLNTTHRREIQEFDEISVPVGEALTSFIDVRDIGEVAAITLTKDGYQNQAIDLTGGAALSYWQVADQLSNMLKRKITYRNPSPIRFFFDHLRRKTPWMFALVMTGLYISTRNGMGSPVTKEVKNITGRDPRTFEQYAIDYADSWKKLSD